MNDFLTIAERPVLHGQTISKMHDFYPYISRRVEKMTRAILQNTLCTVHFRSGYNYLSK